MKAPYGLVHFAMKAGMRDVRIPVIPTGSGRHVVGGFVPDEDEAEEDAARQDEDEVAGLKHQRGRHGTVEPWVS